MEYENKDMLRKIMYCLKQRELEIFYMRAFKDMSYAEIGREMGLSLERTRQIYKKSCRIISYRMNKLALEVLRA